MISGKQVFKLLLLCSAGALIQIALVSTAAAQEKVRVRGVLFDPWSAVVVGATVYAENQALNIHAYSNDEGAFYFDLPSGAYTLRVQARGFKKYLIQNFEVREGRVQDVTIHLEIYPGPYLYFYRPDSDDRIEPVSAPLPDRIEPRKISSASFAIPGELCANVSVADSLTQSSQRTAKIARLFS